MIIYKTTNLINGKFYIGKDEKNNSVYLGSGKILKAAIKKYGIENFKKEVLETCKTREELNEREKYWIKELKAIEKGYNLTEGGVGGQTKFKIIYQFNKEGEFIKEWSSAAEIERVLGYDSSSILKCCKNKILSFKTYIWSYNNQTTPYIDTRTKIILQYDKSGLFIQEWKSVNEIKKKFNISDRHIQVVLDKPNKTAKGFIWLRKKEKISDKIEVPQSGYFNNKNAKKNGNKTKQM